MGGAVEAFCVREVPGESKLNRGDGDGMLRGVFFDAAGTLFHTREPAGSSYAKIARRFGVEADERDVVAAFHRAFRQAAGLAFGPGRDAAELRGLERRWWRDLVARTFEGVGNFSDFDAYFEELFAFFADPAHWIRDPEAQTVLAGLKSRDLVLGVISNFDHRIYRILDGLDLTRFFDSLTISSEVGYAKPSPEIFRAALARHSLTPTQAIHVGDSEALDIAGASAAGLRAVLIDPGCESTASDGRCARVRSLGQVSDTLALMGTS
jgi:putative hydrolase of the HAD superfamily